MGRPSQTSLKIFTVFLSLTLCALLLEGALWFFPVRSYIPFQPVTPDSPVVRYEPHKTYDYSLGWDFRGVNHGRTNAQGFVSDFDYQMDDTRPLIAVIGDSFIEGMMVPFKDTVQEHLHKDLDDKFRVYNFAIGGSPLSEYLAFAEYARDNYHPGFVIVNVVLNDFDESLPEYKNKPRFQYFVADDAGNLTPQLIADYHPSLIKELLSRSALVRYLYFHLYISNIFNRIDFAVRQDKVKTPAAGLTKSKESPDDRKTELSKLATDAFLRLLPQRSGLSKNRILIVVDGVRDGIYSGTVNEKMKKTLFGNMRTYLINNARQQGFEVLDLQPVFEKHYAEHGQIFDFGTDAHWNALAHGIVAQEIEKTKGFQSFISR